MRPFNRAVYAPFAVFVCIWTVLFVLYFPARHAGFVSDVTGWLQDIQTHSFSDHITRKHFVVKSMYQFTQLVTWALYRLFGTNALLWHLAQITLHALNAALAFRIFCAALPKQDRVFKTAFFVALLCITCRPGLSEVIVWEASFHYLLGMLMILLQLLCVLKYAETGSQTYLLGGILLFACSTFSIEVFYVSPILCIGLQALLLRKEKPIWFQTSLWRFTLPQVILIAVHFFLVKSLLGTALPHIQSAALRATPLHEIFAKPMNWLFNELLFGRYLPSQLRNLFFSMSADVFFQLVFYALVLIVWPQIVWQSKRLRPMRALLLWLHFSAFALLIPVLPMQFPFEFSVVYDRYGYFFTFFMFAEVAAVAVLLMNKKLLIAAASLFLLAGIYKAVKLNRAWAASQKMTAHLLNTLPDESDKVVLLLNMPHDLNGIFMMPANPSNEAKTMRNTLCKQKISYPLIDVMGSHLHDLKDGAHVKVVDSATLDLALNQDGTWFLYDEKGAAPTTNDLYSLEVFEYSLRIHLKKHPADYTILFQNGGNWKTADMSRVGKDQY